LAFFSAFPIELFDVESAPAFVDDLQPRPMPRNRLKISNRFVR
jgi:hypothetical protein